MLTRYGEFVETNRALGLENLRKTLEAGVTVAMGTDAVVRVSVSDVSLDLADGAITAADFRLCLARCVAQTGGCPLEEPPAPGGGVGFGGCGLLGIELLLVPLAARLRRRSRAAGRASF